MIDTEISSIESIKSTGNPRLQTENVKCFEDPGIKDPQSLQNFASPVFLVPQFGHLVIVNLYLDNRVNIEIR